MATPLPHLYAVLGDGRLNIVGSQKALQTIASALNTLSIDGQSRDYDLTVAEMPHYGLSLRRLVCTKDDRSLRRIVANDLVFVAGNEDGLRHLASAFEWQAKTWKEGGHQHIYPGQDYSDDRGGYLVSPDSEEMLIGGHGYLPDEMFGLRGEN